MGATTNDDIERIADEHLESRRARARRLVERARAAAFDGSAEVGAAIDDALEDEHDPAARGLLLCARVVCRQATVPFDEMLEDALAASGLLREADDPLELTATALGAGVASRAGALEVAVELAIDAMVRMGPTPEPSHETASQANNLSVVFHDLGATDLALQQAEIAFRSVEDVSSPGFSITAGNLCYYLIEAARNALALGEDATGLLDQATATVAELRRSVSEVQREVMGRTYAAEVALLRGDDQEAARHIADAVPMVADSGPYPEAWFGLAAAATAEASGDAGLAFERADPLVDAAAIVGDHHRRRRALRIRSTAAGALGRHEQAWADALALADMEHRRAIRRVPRLARQLVRAVELERNRSILESRADAMARAAEMDALTGVASRLLLERTLANPPFDRSVGIAIVDLDDLKGRNDRYGHEAGDRVLRHVATALRSAVRPADLVARFGGDEFVVVVSGAGHDATVQTAQRLHRAVANQHWAGKGDDPTVSIGAASGTPSEIRATLRRADAALYAAKRAGRDRVVTV